MRGVLRPWLFGYQSSDNAPLKYDFLAVRNAHVHALCGCGSCVGGRDMFL